MVRATTSYWDRLAKERLYRDRSEEEVQDMDPVEVALAPYRADGSYDGDRVRSDRIREIVFPPQVIRQFSNYDDHRPCRRRPTRSPSPPRRNNNKRACIPASTNAILGLKEVVPSTAIMEDDGCAICLKALTAGQVVKDDDATASADDDLKALAALVADHEEEEDDDDDDDIVDDEKKDAHQDDDDDDDAHQAATVTWLRPLRLRVMPCSHVFHQHCIFKWLTRNAGCPLCRHKLPTTDDDE